MDEPSQLDHKITNRSMPTGIIIPELVYVDLETAVTWLCNAFGFRERLRIGNHRAQLTLEGGSIIAIGNPNLSEESGATSVNNAPHDMQKNHSIMVHIEDMQHHFENAVAFSAMVISPPVDYPFGERQYSVEDIGGHRWTFSQTIGDVDPQDWGGKLVNKDEDASRQLQP